MFLKISFTIDCRRTETTFHHLNGKGVLHMETVIEIFLIVLPIIVVGAIALFVILKLKGKQARGELGKKDSTSTQTLLDSMIPLGMIFGSGLGMVFSMLFPFSLGNGI